MEENLSTEPTSQPTIDGPRQPAYLETVKCVVHQDLDAMHLCSGCTEGVCRTCAFEFGTDVLYCPLCLDGDASVISSGRKTKIVAGMVFNGITVALFSFLFMGGMVGMSVGAAAGLSFLATVSSITAVSFATISLDQRLITPMYAKVSAYISWGLIACLTGMAVVGIMMGYTAGGY